MGACGSQSETAMAVIMLQALDLVAGSSVQGAALSVKYV
jgi:hypothetical protein